MRNKTERQEKQAEDYREATKTKGEINIKASKAVEKQRGKRNKTGNKTERQEKQREK